MKKVKLMLLSLSILAVVGGALAFTVKTGPFYCIAPAPGAVLPSTCPTLGQIKDPINNDDFYATTTTSQDPDRPCKSANGSDLPCFVVQHSTVE